MNFENTKTYIAVGALFIFLIGITSAINLPLNKTQTCSLPIVNLTGAACDSYWCFNGLNGTWTTDGICVINGSSLNQTQTNETNSTVTNSTNETIGNFTSAQFKEAVRNESCIVIENVTGFSCNETQNQTVKKYVDNQTITLRNNILDGEENRTRAQIQLLAPTYLNSADSQGANFSGWMIVVTVALICVLIGFSIHSKKTQVPMDAKVSTYKRSIIQNAKKLESEPAQGQEQEPAPPAQEKQGPDPAPPKINWKDHVAQFRKDHPEISGTDVLKEASKTYNK